jgi:serine/threonine-protein kinase SRPK3
MTAIMGYLPTYMIKEGKFSPHYFNRKCEFLHCTSKYPKIKLSELLRNYNYGKEYTEENISEEIELFSDFLSHLVELDPKKRWNATQCKLHPWLKSVHDNFTNNELKAFILE